MNDDDMSVTVLAQIANALELQNKILEDHKKFIEQLFQQNAKLQKRLESLEAADSLDSSDVEFLAGIAARLATIKKNVNNVSEMRRQSVDSL